jgi:hypothetical protein
LINLTTITMTVARFVVCSLHWMIFQYNYKVK